MSEQLDLFSAYECDPRGATGINIWYRDDSREFPDLECEITGIRGQYVGFYVINGDWDGRLDLTCKEMYIEYTKKRLPIHKYEFIYDKPEKVLDTDNIPYQDTHIQ